MDKLEINTSRCTKYKFCYFGPYYDEFGRRYKQIRKVFSFNSVNDMELDINEFLDFIEYVEGSELDDEDRFYGEEISNNDDRDRT